MVDKNFTWVWLNMKSRCYNSNNISFKDYGGRGIKVCERWHHLKQFRADMFATYKKGLSLERIDNDGSYSPENCRWATKKEQARNRRNTRLFKGKTLSEWSEILGVKQSTLSQRLYVYKWPIERVLTNNI